MPRNFAGELDLNFQKWEMTLCFFPKTFQTEPALIKPALEKGEISELTAAESVKEILRISKFIRLQNFEIINSENINEDLNNASHAELFRKIIFKRNNFVERRKNLFAFKLQQNLLLSSSWKSAVSEFCRSF